jgi:hypothetical protein
MYMENAATNHQDVADPDATASGAAGTGQENEDLKWGRRHIVWDAPLHVEPVHPGPAQLVERVTALHDIEPAPGQERPLQHVHPEKKRERKIPSLQIISCEDDAAHCSQVSELFFQQEKMSESLLVMINDLQYRVDELEYFRRIAARIKSGTRPEERP